MPVAPMIAASRTRRLLAGLAVAGLAVAAAPAQARPHLRFEIGGDDHRPPTSVVVRQQQVWVEPVYRTECDRQWVPPVVRTVTAPVWVDPVTRTVVRPVYVPEQGGWQTVGGCDAYGRVARRRQWVVTVPAHYEDRCQTVCTAPGYYQDQGRQEVVCDGHWEAVDRQELVCAGHWETRTVTAPVCPPPYRPGILIRLPF